MLNNTSIYKSSRQLKLFTLLKKVLNIWFLMFSLLGIFINLMNNSFIDQKFNFLTTNRQNSIIKGDYGYPPFFHWIISKFHISKMLHMIETTILTRCQISSEHDFGSLFWNFIY